MSLVNDIPKFRASDLHYNHPDNQKDTNMPTLDDSLSLDVYTVELDYDQLQLVMKATQISLTHAGQRIQRTEGRQRDTARHEYTTLSNAVNELQEALDEALGVN